MPNPILLTPETLHTLVLDYLVKNCYTRTAKSFLNALATPTLTHLPPHSTTLASKYAPLLQTADQRHQILQLLLEGAVLDALKLIQTSGFNCKFASVFPILNFRLHCQHFIELLRAGNVHEALQFAQDDLAALARQSQHMIHVLQVLHSLINLLTGCRRLQVLWHMRTLSSLRMLQCLIRKYGVF